MYLVNSFFIYSIVGYLFESIIYLFCEGESGILYGPWTPVYGIGVVILFIFLNIFKNKNYSKKIISFNIFLIGFLILTLIEFIGGHLLESLFGIVFWNYEGLKFNIGKYISLEISLVWGILSLVCVYLFKPITDKLEKKIPMWLTWILIISFLIDVFFTVIIKSDLFIFLYEFF